METAVRSERPRNARITAKKAVAGEGLLKDAASGWEFS